MFSSLKNNFSQLINKVKNKGLISESDLETTLREIRISFLEADVALPVSKKLIEYIKERALGEKLIDSITPGQMIVKIVYDALKNILGEEKQELRLTTQLQPAVIMLVGLQGVGKTTTAAKLAVFIKKQYKKKVLLVSLDTSRPAAQRQLEILSQEALIESLPIIEGQQPVEILRRALKFSLENSFDIVILDTAGRLHNNETLMEELKNIKEISQPTEVLLTVDSMSGQDAINSAQSFCNLIDVSGIIMTRIDGDSKGGAALSVKYITGCPIKLLGNGEKLLDLEVFYPDRIASRILDMGDVVTLVEKAMEVVTEEENKSLAQKLQQGKFNMEDLRKHLKNINKMGGFASILGMLPGISKIKKVLNSENFNKRIIDRQIAIIDSMTKKEKTYPSIINASRKNRIAKGSGVKVQDVNKTLKQFLEMQKMIKMMGNFEEKKLGKFKNIFK